MFAADTSGYIFSIRSDDTGYKNELIEKLNWPITAIASCDRSTITIADFKGKISTYAVSSYKSIIKVYEYIPELEFPINSMISFDMGNRILVAGYENGSILLYNKTHRVLICCHSRAVTCIAKHPTKPIIYSAGEDGSVYGYEITFADDKLGVDVVMSSYIDNCILTGITYCEKYDKLVAISYDNNTLYYWKNK